MGVRGRGIVVAAAAVAVAAAGGTAMADHSATGGHLDVCCAWNSALGDGVLTYRVSGGDVAARTVVAAAVEDWDVALGRDLRLDPTTAKTADITISFKKGGGQTQGVALRSFDRAGFVRSVKVTISGQAFGLPNNAATVAQITRHEVGHALGLGHSDFPDLMFPTLGAEDEISGCDITGVRTANAWAFDGGTVPVRPAVTAIGC
jgi:hypothetical protein